MALLPPGREPVAADPVSPIGAEEFAASMARLGPFESMPRLAVAVSGGADSLCLTLLADTWARVQGGEVLALIVDHGLRATAKEEARHVGHVLGGRGIRARVLVLRDLQAGPGIAARAREARYGALRVACLEAGILHLLLGHHAADQAETVLIRALGRSGGAGMAGMARLVEIPALRLLRPLLTQPPGRLRASLRAAGVAWAEDPSNRDAAALRPRLRLLRRDCEGAGSAGAALVAAASAAARQRHAREIACAAFLAEHVTLRPEGFAILPDGPVPPDVLAALARAISGSFYPPAGAAIAALAVNPRPATFAGVRLMRWRSQMILLREARAMAPPIAVCSNAFWDGRFRLRGVFPANLLHHRLGAVGDAAARLRCRSELPAAVLATLPALRCGDRLVAVPHLRNPAPSTPADVEIWFTPANPAAGAWFPVD